MDKNRMKAYAKINLGLDVVKRLPNGYHQVKMVMQSIGLWDELTFQKTEAGITIITDSDQLPTGENNLVYKAAKLMFEKYNLPSGIHIHLQKNIPIAAGMAGGSTDAAATMKGIQHLFGLDVPLSKLMELAVTIGADVPYCLMGGTALAEGIGEKLTPLPPMPKCLILVAKPDIMVSTKYVYEHFDIQNVGQISGFDGSMKGQDAIGCHSHPDIGKMVEAVKDNNLPDILACMGNVLETVTIPAYPVIDQIKRRMLELGAAGSLMSGSGPTVFGIFPTDQADVAKTAFESISQEGMAKQIFLVTPQPAQEQ